MYHCTTDSSYLGVREKVVHLWHDYVPQQALKHPFLMHGLLAFAALHLAYLRPTSSSKYLQLCDKHQSIALRKFRSILSSPTDPELLDALLALAATFSLSSMARSCALSETVTMDMDAVAELFLLTRGIATVIRLSRKHIMQGPLTEMLQVYTYPKGTQFRLPTTVAARFEALRRMLTSYGLDEDELKHCQSALTELEEIYKNIAYLAPTTNIETDVLSRWQVLVPIEYIRLIQAHNPPALVILAYYAAAITAIRTAWYTQNWADYALRGISQVLDSSMREWIEWPMQQMQERMTELGVQSPAVFKEQLVSLPLRYTSQTEAPRLVM